MLLDQFQAVPLNPFVVAQIEPAVAAAEVEDRARLLLEFMISRSRTGSLE